MLTYITECDNLVKVTEELGIGEGDVPSMNQGQRDTLAEIITVLAEVRRVSYQLEADRRVIMSRDLYEALLVLSAAINVATVDYCDIVAA